MGLADDRKPVNLMTVHVSKSVTAHEVSNNFIWSRIHDKKKKERKRQVLHIENKIKYDLLHILWCIAMR